MRRAKAAVGMLMALTGIVLPIRRAQAQGPTAWMADALVNALTKMKILNDKGMNVSFTRNHFAVLGGLFNERQTFTQELTLSGGVTYYFIGGGDQDVRVSNIFLYDDNNRVVAQDNETDATPIVVFTPTADAPYRVQLRLWETDRHVSSYCVLLILKKQ